MFYKKLELCEKKHFPGDMPIQTDERKKMKMSIIKVEHNELKGIKTYRCFGIKFWTRLDKQSIKKINDNISALNQEVGFLRSLLEPLVDTTKLQAATGALREQQLASFEILKTLDKLCKGNQCAYWLDFGTLIGAARHKGFIPWDDDIDVCMLREDYNKIIPILKEFYKNHPQLSVRERYENHFQVRIMSPEADIALDIFPVDVCSFENLNHLEKDSINKKIKEVTQELKQNISKRKLEMPQIRSLIENLSKKIIDFKVEQNGRSLFYGIDYPHLHREQWMKYDIIFPLKTLSFEGSEFPVPNDYDQHLRILYGDYMALPTKQDLTKKR